MMNLAEKASALLIAAAVAGGGVAQTDMWLEVAAANNLSGDLDIVGDEIMLARSYATGESLQDIVDRTVASLELTPGTEIAAEVLPDGVNYALTATSDSVTSYTVQYFSGGENTKPGVTVTSVE